MKMVQVKTLLILFIMIPFFLTGCMQQKQLEKMGLQVALGYDRLEDHRILGTSVLHNFEQQTKPTQVLSSTAFTSKGLRQTMNREINRKMVSGQIRVAVFGKETASHGILPLIDSMSRDPEIGTMVYLLISNGRANELLSGDYKTIPNIGTFLYQMIRQNIEGEQIVSSTLHEFLSDYYCTGKDPAMPILTKVNEDVQITGLAIFKGDKMVGTLKARESFYVKLIRDRFKAGSLEISVPKGKFNKMIKKKTNGTEKGIFLSFDNISSKTKIRLMDKEQPKFDVKIELTTRLQELSEELDFSDPKVIQTLQKEMSKALTNEANLLIKKLQKLESDPIGFGNVYRSSVRGAKLTEGNWSKMYKEAKINIKVDAVITRTGVVD